MCERARCKMATTLDAINTGHDDMIHDAQVDYYGKRLATCSSDRKVKIFNVAGGSPDQRPTAELTGHEGPVWEVAWAHPKFGSILASCSYDKKVIIWQESGQGWEKKYEHAVHESSVNAIAWAPHEFEELTLACGSSDGDVSILTCTDNVWSCVKIQGAHQLGCTSVSWAPALLPAAGVQAQGSRVLTKRFISGGCDSLAKIWAFREDRGWVLEQSLQGHTDWVRDVSWAPGIGLPSSTIATCSQDCSVIIWTQDKSASEEWNKHVLKTFGSCVWRVSWSITGNILAVSCADNKVSLWKEALDGEWNCVSEMNESAGTSADAAAL